MTELMPSLCNDCVARNQCGNDDVKMCVSYIKEVKIKCDDCKFQEECVDYGWEGCKKFTPAPSKPMTNEEWFCGLSTEEKATYITDIIDECLTWTYGIVMSVKVRKVQSSFIERWLKEKHNEMS